MNQKTLYPIQITSFTASFYTFYKWSLQNHSFKCRSNIVFVFWYYTLHWLNTGPVRRRLSHRESLAWWWSCETRHTDLGRLISKPISRLENIKSDRKIFFCLLLEKHFAKTARRKKKAASNYWRENVAMIHFRFSKTNPVVCKCSGAGSKATRQQRLWIIDGTHPLLIDH